MDLTTVAARLDLRRPKATTSSTGGYHGAQETHTCLDSKHNTGALHTSLTSLDRTNYQVGDEPTFEVTVQNTGSTPTRIPISPHLADLQPKNPAQKFAYHELQVVLWIAAEGRWSTNTGGTVILYGADDHANTMMTLNPGAWLRLVAKGHFSLGDDLIRLTRSGYPADHAYAETSLFRDETLITPTQSATVAREICLIKTNGQVVPIQLTLP